MNQNNPGELRELVNVLDGLRQKVAHAFGAEARELFLTIDKALKSSDLDMCRKALRKAVDWRDNRTLEAIEAMREAINAEGNHNPA